MFWMKPIQGSQNWPLTKRLVEDFISARLLTNERMLMRFLELLLEVQSGEKVGWLFQQYLGFVKRMLLPLLLLDFPSLYR